MKNVVNWESLIAFNEGLIGSLKVEHSVLENRG